VDDPPDDFEDRPTAVEAIPSEVMAGEEVTAPHAVEELPGFEVGWVLSRRRALADACEHLRLTLIDGGTEPGTAALVATKFGRRCGLRYR
jgi:hypothetical protein